MLVVFQVALAVILLAVAVAAASLVVRFRRASGAERQQLRWVALAAAVIALLFVVIVGAVAIGAPALPDPGLVGTACLVVLTLGIGAATLRYRLYDLDRIISRTLAYGLLTVLLGLGYTAVVLGLGRLLPRGSSLVVAVATLAVAAAFQPARRSIQGGVDRRFNRRRYDAAQTIAAFGDRLRQQVDLDTLSVELLRVIEETMQPTRASLWLRPQAPANKAEEQAAASTTA
jgi:peptidoglycan/LPS O-acetylase OafA/YrhL